jgi:hypothetical protein
MNASEVFSLGFPFISSYLSETSNGEECGFCKANVELVLDTLDELQEDTCDGSFQVKRT